MALMGNFHAELVQAVRINRGLQKGVGTGLVFLRPTDAADRFRKAKCPARHIIALIGSQLR